MRMKLQAWFCFHYNHLDFMTAFQLTSQAVKIKRISKIKSSNLFKRERQDLWKQATDNEEVF